MRVKGLAWSATLLLLLVAYSSALAQDAPQANAKDEAQAQKIDSRRQRAGSDAPAAPAAVINTNGGAVKNVWAATSNTSTITTSTAFVQLAGAARTFTVPTGGDTVVITFSAECELLPSDNDGNDWVGVQIRDNSTVIGGGPDGSFCGSQAYGQHSMQIVRRLAAGTHTIKVYWQTTDATKEAWLDDWALVILQSD
ncbi:MAG TPA: hypothetical protein VF708_06965 [Pyrinomonadaceae bacterium]|jgi:hypothetical protein